jgi:hypothetical protein
VGQGTFVGRDLEGDHLPAIAATQRIVVIARYTSTAVALHWTVALIVNTATSRPHLCRCRESRTPGVEICLCPRLMRHGSVVAVDASRCRMAVHGIPKARATSSRHTSVSYKEV